MSNLHRRNPLRANDRSRISLREDSFHARERLLPRDLLIMTRVILHLLAGAWLLAVILIIALADTESARWFFLWVESHHGTDKAGHFFLIGGMAFFLNAALGCRRVDWMGTRWLTGSLVVATVFTLEEISQIWIPSRHFDFGDLAADFAGILLFGWLAQLFFKKPVPARVPR